MSEDKVLPKDSDSDYSLPGRYEESNFSYESPITPYQSTPKSKSKGLAIGVIAFTIISAGFFSYYLLNQNEIDSQIIQNTLNMSPEQVLANQYNIGKYGSDSTKVLKLFEDIFGWLPLATIVNAAKR